MRALVVDDSRAMRALVRRTLRESGFEVEEAADGQEGLERLRAGGRFDVALIDWHMPRMDGYELVRAVRADPALAALPMVMVTSVSEGDQVARALEAGANEFIMKPFTRDALVARLRMLGLG
jgi:two-component system chemotaxis response regulator CheY